MQNRNAGEQEFIEWLNCNDLPFIYVEQSLETYSRHFQNKIKRPDFHIVIHGLGVIAVDVKCQPFKKDIYKTFTLGQDEYDRLQSYSQNFNIPVWIVYASRPKNIDAWHWLNIRHFEEVAELRENSKDHTSFYVIDVKACKTLGITDQLGKILL